MKTKYKHIYFEPECDGAYLCRNNKTKGILGHIEYYSHWRKHIVQFSSQAVFDEGCLLDIVDFLKQLGD